MQPSQLDRDMPVSVAVRAGYVWITLKDDRIIGAPLDWYPWLAQASDAQQADYQTGLHGVTWTQLEEMLDVDELLHGSHQRQEDPGLTLTEAAELKGCTIQTVRNAVWKGKFPYTVDNPEASERRWIYKIPNSEEFRAWMPRRYKKHREPDKLQATE